MELRRGSDHRPLTSWENTELGKERDALSWSTEYRNVKEGVVGPIALKRLDETLIYLLVRITSVMPLLGSTSTSTSTSSVLAATSSWRNRSKGSDTNSYFFVSVEKASLTLWWLRVKMRSVYDAKDRRSSVGRCVTADFTAPLP